MCFGLNNYQISKVKKSKPITCRFIAFVCVCYSSPEASLYSQTKLQYLAEMQLRNVVSQGIALEYFLTSPVAAHELNWIEPSSKHVGLFVLRSRNAQHLQGRYQIKSNFFAQNTSHFTAASSKSSWWAGPTRLKRALTVTLKRQVKQILSTNNGIVFKDKLLKTQTT